MQSPERAHNQACSRSALAASTGSADAKIFRSSLDSGTSTRVKLSSGSSGSRVFVRSDSLTRSIPPASEHSIASFSGVRSTAAPTLPGTSANSNRNVCRNMRLRGLKKKFERNCTPQEQPRPTEDLFLPKLRRLQPRQVRAWPGVRRNAIRSSLCSSIRAPVHRQDLPAYAHIPVVLLRIFPVAEQRMAKL